MSMQNKVKELVRVKGITPYRFWKDVGCSRDVAYKLVNDSSYIPRENVLEAICRAYNVQPGDLLEYVPSGEVKA
jgi:DNA-binding Xre family transcriptional regulator